MKLFKISKRRCPICGGYLKKEKDKSSSSGRLVCERCMIAFKGDTTSFLNSLRQDF